ncbi:MAG: dienelactone hydrolase family protein [Pseudomonadota bacterium]
MPDHQKITYAVHDQTMESVVVRPAQGGQTTPCVLVCHDWSGINVHTIATCEELAKLSYTAFAVDAYGQGKRGDPVGDNTALMAPCLADRGLLQERMLAALRAAAGLPFVDTARIAALGYCFGGLCGLDLARSDPDGLVAMISVHGGLSPPQGWTPSRMRARLLLLHGWNDPMVPPDEVLAVASAFTSAGAQWEMHAYGHAMHAFTFEGANFPERGIQHHPLAHRRSWEATRLFLDEVFGNR